MQDMDRNTIYYSAALRLEYATLAWNAVGFGVLVLSAHACRSIALAGFGIDSVIEVFASVTVVWQLKSINRDTEKPALKLIGGTFFLLAGYILLQSVYALHNHVRAAPSVSGVAWLVATVAVMLALSRGKSYAGKRLSNPVMVGEAKITLVDALLAGSVLVGLVCNFAFSWWWADSAASLVIFFYGIKEGFRLFFQKACTHQLRHFNSLRTVLSDLPQGTVELLDNLDVKETNFIVFQCQAIEK